MEKNWFLFVEKGTASLQQICEIGWFPDSEDDIEIWQDEVSCEGFESYEVAEKYAMEKLDTSWWCQAHAELDKIIF